MNKLFTMKSLDVYLAVCDLAIKNGKKPGDSMQSEFDEVMKQHPEWFGYIGESEKDLDMLTGDLREKGKKVLNIHEIERQQGNKNG